MSTNSTVLSGMAIFALFCALPAVAQTQPADTLTFKVDSSGLHQSETDLSDSSGGFSVDRWFISARVNYAWGARSAIGFSMGGGQSNYVFNDLGGFAGGTPWDKVTDTRASALWLFGIGETGSVILTPTIRINNEKGASSGDSSTYGLYAAAAWRINENLTIGPGIGVFTRLEDGSRIFPFLAIEWNITDRWSLSTGRGPAISQSPGLALSYELNDAWSFGFAGRYEDTEFRLDDKGTAAGGIGRDQSVPLVFTATLQAGPKFRLLVFAGTLFNGTLKLKDSMGDLVDESSFDATPIIGVSFDAQF